MKARKNNNKPNFVRFNDGKIEHVTAGPEYGQPWKTQTVWDEFESVEYAGWVEEIQSAILRIRRIRI